MKRKIGGKESKDLQEYADNYITESQDYSLSNAESIEFFHNIFKEQWGYPIEPLKEGDSHFKKL